ncbi:MULTISPECIES: cation:proton antiporter [unclassified Janthinobacterium]|uniref:cation:proton antiporter domain-containing protein n=1 Tax=unclassified Janthinobacterium TaxID=2610881 RepID=UPI00160F4682|nr:MULTISPECIES: cation:proton antiporter [unclassified Janthinobacterium]MBB5367804.1 CPA2 family monovalent cation:H+ antiporter-2 [Janthinobacterium sp. K2C7]MBB5379718.1 CPA2 family monovalent cation:H+ antiporter-2 [Janthinobacterium sp. K2Li3]MBB5386186.1 CPA2 family monovalent cation:H+ antiporter-2 [Janthinobacterium sp. K2E3]
MEEQHALPYLRETLLFLALAGIFIPLLQRLKVNQVLGFLAVGALFGPFGFGLWAGDFGWLRYFSFVRAEQVSGLAELGVMFLMFMIGLELSTERLWALRRWVFGAGVGQVAASAGLIGAAVYYLGLPLEASIVLGLVLSLSSTAVVMQLLADRRSLQTPAGQAGFSILMFQDLMVVPLFILIDVFASGHSEDLVYLLSFAVVKSAGAILLIYLLGRRVIRPLFQFFVKKHQPDVFMALTLLSTLGIAGLTYLAGLSMALGALLAGLLLAETEFRHEVEVTIEPFKGLLMGLFFMSVGMQIDVREIIKSPILIPLAVLSLFAIKTLVISVIFRLGGFHWGRAVETGVLLGQGGEFAFIVVAYALGTKLIAPQVAQFVMLVVGLSLFATPALSRAARGFGNWWEQRHRHQLADLADDALPPQGSQVIIAGFGRVGQLLAKVLTEQDIAYVAIENDAKLVTTMHPRGFPVYFGDASRAELLQKVNADRAAAVVLTMDHPASVLHAVKSIRRDYPHLPVYARARDEANAVALVLAGATLVVPEALESALQLTATVLQTVGLPEARAAEVVQTERERRNAVLLAKKLL